MSLRFFYGDEEFLMEQEINKLKDKLLDKNFSSMNYKYVKSPIYQDFISLLQTQPMMFGAQIIVIDIENFFTMSLEDNQVEEIKNAFENLSDTLNIILTLNFERNSKKKPDSRKKIYKLITKYAELKEFESIPVYKTEELINFVNKVAKKQDIVIEKSASTKLIEQVGNNLRELTNEIEKLYLIAYPKNKVTEQMVKTICITNEDVFALTDKLFIGKKAYALKEFRKLCDKQYPMALLSTLQTNLRKVIFMKLNEKKMSIPQIAKSIGMNEYIVQLKLQDLKNSNLKELIKLKRNLINAEFKIKSGNSLDVQNEIELALFKQ